MAMNLPTRRITLTVKSAELSYKRRSFSAGKNCYVEMVIGRKTRETGMCKNGGLNPSWGYELTFEYKNEPFMEFVVYEKGFKKHYIADARLDLQTLRDEECDLSIPLVRFPTSKKPVQVGDLIISVELEGFGRSMRPQQMMGSMMMNPMGSLMMNPMGSMMMNPMMNPMGSLDNEPAAQKNQWQVSTNAGWLNLPTNVSEKVEKVHACADAGGLQKVEIQANDGFTYTFDVVALTQTNHTTGEVREIRRS